MTANKKRKDAHLWQRDPDDYYVEPRWVDEALFALEPFEGMITDPSCGLGRILDAARALRYSTYGMDIVDRGASARHRFTQCDFFQARGDFDNIVSNPPYKFGQAFLGRAIERSRRKTAFLLRAQWANAAHRSAWLATLPLKRVLMVSPRPSMPPGAVVEAMGEKNPSGGLQDYAWFIFERGFEGVPTFGWAHRAPKVTPPARDVTISRRAARLQGSTT